MLSKLWSYHYFCRIRFLFPVMGCLGLFALLGGLSAPAYELDMIADIRSSTTTAFATYAPIRVETTPAVPAYTISPDLSNVTNRAKFSFNTVETALLQQNGFVVTQTPFAEMADVYADAFERDLPIFVSVDSLLHAYHKTFSYILRGIESDVLFDDLDALTQALVTASLDQYNAASADSVLQEAARRNVAFFSVAASLLDDSFAVPPLVADLVTAETEKILAHNATALSVIFEYTEDYTQYKPRGHYTLSERLERYFRAMMWYGRMSFHFRQVGYPPEPSLDGIQRATVQALLLSRLMMELPVDATTAAALWDRIYVTTSFFVGKANDFTWREYAAVARPIFDAEVTDVPLEMLDDLDKVDSMIAALKALPSKEIFSNHAPSMRFMSQRVIPDSHMIWNLIYDRTAQRWPRGLDVMSVLGSERAYQIIDEVYGDTSDPKYVSQMAAVKAQYDALPDDTWAQNLYWNWLYCLMPSLAPKGDGFPTFMQNEGWADKEISGALGSWAELRHDTILYAMQANPTVTPGIDPTPPPAPTPLYEDAYVEPNPWAFARLTALTQMSREGLEGLGLLTEDYAERLNLLEEYTTDFRYMAQKELEMQPLSPVDVRKIRMFWSPLKHLTVLRHPERWDEEDKRMELIADIHTDNLSGTLECVEVGVGRPNAVYVLIGSSNQLHIAVGAAYSYYEFLQPAANRLNDEEWRAMLRSASPPQQPEWMDSFLDLNHTLPYVYPQNESALNYASQGVTSIAVVPDNPAVGETIEIRVTFSMDLSDANMTAHVACGMKAADLALQRVSGGSLYEWYCTLDTTGWPGGELEVSVYSPTNADLFGSAEFVLTAAAEPTPPTPTPTPTPSPTPTPTPVIDGDALLMLADATAPQGGVVRVPLMVRGMVADMQLAGINIKVHFDKALLTNPQVVAGPILPANARLESRVIDDSILSVVAYHPSIGEPFLQNNGIVLYLDFAVAANAPVGVESPITFLSEIAYDPPVSNNALAGVLGAPIPIGQADGCVVRVVESGSEAAVDRDGDGKPDDSETTDLLELAVGVMTNAILRDSDGDGLLDSEEWCADCGTAKSLTATNPRKRDTDGDGFPDGVEFFIMGTDPLDANDPPVGMHTDADGDGLPALFDEDDSSRDANQNRYLDAYEMVRRESPNGLGSDSLLGDVDGVSGANNLDAIQIFNITLGNLTMDDLLLPENSDVMSDGMINNLDAIVLFNWSLHLLDVIPLYGATASNQTNTVRLRSIGIESDLTEESLLEYLLAPTEDVAAIPDGADVNQDGIVDVADILVYLATAPARNILVEVFCDGWGEFLYSFIVPKAGQASDPIMGGCEYYDPPQYYYYMSATGFYTEIGYCLEGEQVTPDLDHVVPGVFNGVIFITENFFRDYYCDDTLVTFTQNGEVVATTTTDSQGRFTVDLPSGNYRMTFTYDEWFGGSIDMGVSIVEGGYRDFIVRDQNATPVPKPVIYLYPEEGIELDVSIYMPYGGTITKSEPEYGDGWHVSVDPSGLIDGQYPYLFYETYQVSLPQLSSGWVVEMTQLEAFFRENMAQTGFIDHEIEDFVEYWIPRLNESPYYVLYPQYNEELLDVVQLNFSIQPDNLIRLIYFVRGVNTADAPVKTPTIPPFSREGFTATEWGLVQLGNQPQD